MKTLLTLAVLAAIVTPACASESPRPAESISVHSPRTDLTPRERVVQNARNSYYASEEYASLKTRYDTSIADPSLVDRVLAELKGSPALADRVMRLKVSSEGRTLRLEGIDNDAAEKKLVAETASEVDGVETVKNELRIKRSDRDLLEGEI